MRNIELKARCMDLRQAADAAEAAGARRVWVRRQVDTYFRVAHGRLKLRVSEPGGAELVAYERTDAPLARESLYDLTPVADPQATLAELAARHGIAVRVEKTRTLYVLANVRIHLDEVAGLGTFVEFEAVMGEGDSEAEARAMLERLSKALGIGPGDVLAGSYADMVSGTAERGLSLSSSSSSSSSSS